MAFTYHVRDAFGVDMLSALTDEDYKKLAIGYTEEMIQYEMQKYKQTDKLCRGDEAERTKADIEKNQRARDEKVSKILKMSNGEIGTPEFKAQFTPSELAYIDELRLSQQRLAANLNPIVPPSAIEGSAPQAEQRRLARNTTSPSTIRRLSM